MGDGDAGSERPRERLEREGPESLALVELLALVLQTGAPGSGALRLAHALLERFGSLDALARAGTAELRAVRGLGPAKICSLRAAFEIGSRLLRTPVAPGEKLHSPEQVAAHFGARMRRLPTGGVRRAPARQPPPPDRRGGSDRGSLNQSLVHPREVSRRPCASRPRRSWSFTTTERRSAAQPRGPRGHAAPGSRG